MRIVRNRCCVWSIAASMLLWWIFALLVGVVHGCITHDVSHRSIDALSAAHSHTDDHGHDVSTMTSKHDDALCQAACDAQLAPSALSDKSFDASHHDRLIPQLFASIQVVLPPSVYLTAAIVDTLFIYRNAVLLRSTRLII